MKYANIKMPDVTFHSSVQTENKWMLILSSAPVNLPSYFPPPTTIFCLFKMELVWICLSIYTPVRKYGAGENNISCPRNAHTHVLSDHFSNLLVLVLFYICYGSYCYYYQYQMMANFHSNNILSAISMYH